MVLEKAASEHDQQTARRQEERELQEQQQVAAVMELKKILDAEKNKYKKAIEESKSQNTVLQQQLKDQKAEAVKQQDRVERLAAFEKHAGNTQLNDMKTRMKRHLRKLKKKRVLKVLTQKQICDWAVTHLESELADPKWVMQL